MRWSRSPDVASSWDLGRVVACFVGGLVALVGVAVLGASLMFRSAAVRAWAMRQATEFVHETFGVAVTFALDRPTWPPGVVVRDVRVESTTAGRPFATTTRAEVTLRPFALLSGEVNVDKIAVDDAWVDADLLDGKPQNLALVDIKPSSKKHVRGHEPYVHEVHLHGAHGHVSSRTTGADGPSAPFVLDLQAIDVDVAASGESTFVYDVHVARDARDVGGVGTLVSPRTVINPPVPADRFAPKTKIPFESYDVLDEDAVCDLGLDALVSDAPGSLTVTLKRLDLEARVDISDALGTTPSCTATDVHPEQIGSLHASGLDLVVPTADSAAGVQLIASRAESRIQVRGSLTIASRYVKLPPMTGWADVAVTPTMTIDLSDPMAGLLKASVNGVLDARELRLEQFRFGSKVSGSFFLKPPLIVGAQELTMEYGDGRVKLTDFLLELWSKPDAKQRLPIQANVQIVNMPWPGLMRELGVSKASWVRWDMDDARALMKGYLDPLDIQGDLKLRTKGFELANGPVELPGHQHMIGVAAKLGPGRADIDAHIVVNPAALVFDRLHLAFGNTRVDGRVHLGFDNKLEVDLDADRIDLSDLSPLVKFNMSGVGHLNYKVRGLFWDPVGEGSFTLADASFADFPLGDIESATTHFRGTTIDFGDMKARYDESTYAVPSMRVDLGRKAGPVVDALFSSKNFSLEDAFAMVHFENDPRWKSYRGHLGFDGRAHFVVGGDEDFCGGGRLQVDLTSNILSLDVFDERFDGGSASLFLDWIDRDGGGLGMDVDLRAVTLKKKGGGTIVTSGKIDRGGKLHLRSVASGIPLRALSSAPPTTIPIDANIDAVAEVGGTIDTMAIDADVRLSPLTVARESLGPSHLRVRRVPAIPDADSTPPDARGCYATGSVAPFDLLRYNADPVQGEYSISGEVFSGTIKVDDLRITDQRVRHARTTPGNPIRVEDVELGPLALMRPSVAEEELDDDFEAPPPITLKGTMSADIFLDDYPIGKWFDSKGKIVLEALAVEQNGAGLELPAGKTSTLSFDDDGVRLDETSFDLRFGTETTALVVAAKLDRSERGRDPTTGSPTVSAKLDLPALPLSKLDDFFPKLERAEGSASARINLAGTLDVPVWDGEINVVDATFAMRGSPTPLSAVNGKIVVDPKVGVKIDKLHGEIGGGTIDMTGGAKIDGFSLGDVDIRVKVHDVHGRADGVSATADANLRVSWSPPEGSDTGATSVPMRLEGSVDINSFLYDTPVKLFDVNGFTQAKRTEVDTYDPTKDAVTFDIEVRAPHGLQIRNNLVDAVVAVGDQGLHVNGSNQRFGLLGALHVIPGGMFKLQHHDFEIRNGDITFNDATRIAPSIDFVGVNDFKRQSTQTSTNAEWRIKLHAYGTQDDLKIELTSEPALAQEDILYLLTVGMTRAEATQLAYGGLLNGGLNVLSDVAGVDQTLRQAIPVIDDYRFGTAFNPKTSRTEPQVTLGKRITDTIRASVTSGIGDQSQLIGSVDWQIAQRLSVQGSYDNATDVTSGALGNLGVNLRYRIEFGD